MTSMQHKPLRLLANRARLIARANSANDECISVAGLASKMGMLEERPSQQPQAPSATVHDAGLASLGKLLQLTRREQALDPAAFASRLGLELKELVDLESAGTIPELRVLYQISAALGISYEKLQMLVGYRVARDESLEGERLKFAASSGPMDKLSKAESQALHDFIRALLD